MPETTRRNLFKAALAGAVAVPLSRAAAAHVPCAPATQAPGWKSGIEGQRTADLGDGTYLNPIIAGDRPDPTILKDGDDYYMTFSSFYAYPGLVIWHSTDLVNWVPIGPALHKSVGVVWAVDLCKHEGRYFIYLPANPSGDGWKIFAIWADDIRGPWSDPVDLKIDGCIDPGHVVITNDNHVVTYRYSRDEGRTWTRLDTRMEVSGLHHNVFGGFLSLKIGIYSAGDGAVRLSDFNYRALV